MTNNAPLTVFYDGACPLCVREMDLLRRLEGGKGRLHFEDIAPPDAAPSCDIAKSKLLARFHARLPDGQMVEGAKAFTESWSQIPYFIWLRPIGRFAPSRWLLNRLYDLFLKVRPRLQRWAGKQS